MLEYKLHEIFPGSKRITPDQITLGTTVAFGGVDENGELNETYFIVARPYKRYDDGTIVYDERVTPSVMYNKNMDDAWYYEIPDVNFSSNPEIMTTHKHTDAVLGKVDATQVEGIDFEEIEPGDIILTGSANRGDIEDMETFWVPEIVVFKAGELTEWGWQVAQTEGTPLTVYTPLTTPYEDEIIHLYKFAGN